MLTEEIGQYYLRTQRELQAIKSQIEALPPQERNGEQGDILHSLYQKVQENITNIQSNINQSSNFFFKQIMGNFDHTVQTLPVVVEDKALIRAHSSSRRLRKKNESKLLPHIDSIVQLNGQSNLNFRPLGQGAYVPKGIQSQYLQQSKKAIESATLLKKKPSKYLTKTNITEKEIIKDGLMGLIQKGRIANIDDTIGLLNVNGAIMRNSQANLYSNKEQHIKKMIQLVSDNKNETLKLDLDRQQEKQITGQSQATQQHTPFKTKNNNANFFRPSINAQIQYEQSRQTEQQQPPNEAMSVNQVMDAFSLHNFMIRNGSVVEEALEYQSFRRTNQKQWIQISSIIKSLEKIAKDCDIQMATINGKMLVETSMKQGLLSLEQLVVCFVNQEEFVLKLRLLSMMFKEPAGKMRAIIKIQSEFRMWRAQRDYARLRIMIEKIKIIQSSVRTFLLYRRTKKRIRAKNNAIYEEFKDSQERFKSIWPFVKLQPRIEVHINNFSFEEMRRLTMEKFLQRQNAQITRIFMLRDPLLSIIYVAPFDLPSEIMNYFYKILELGEIANYKERLHFVWPENHHTFPSHYSTSRLLLLSPKCMNRIKALIKGKVAYVVPGYPSNDDIKLSSQLKVPIYCGEPQTQLINSTKSGSKRLFQELQIPMPPGAYEIYDEKELINTLAILITNNPTVELWLLKIDDECQGRGIASIELRKLGKYFKDPSFAKLPDSVVQVAQILQQKLPTKLNICYPQLFKTYQEYISTFTRRGGIVEASPNYALSQIESPSFFFRIEPDGRVEVLGTFDKIRINDFQTVACNGPKKSLPNLNVQAICQSVGERLYLKGVFGYCQIDLIAFADSTNHLHQRESTTNGMFWAIGMDCYLTTLGSSCFYFELLMKGKLDSQTGQYAVNLYQQSMSSEPSARSDTMIACMAINPDQQRSYLYCPLIINEGLDALQYKTFFQLCRLESISFNLEKKIGSTFILIDSLQSGVLSVMTIGDSFNSVLKYMTDALEFLVKNVGRGQDHTDQFDSRTDKIKMMAIHQKIKLQLKKTETTKSVSHISNIYL